MATMDTHQETWHFLPMAATGQSTDINTHEVAYSATWATAAQNFNAKPATALDIPHEANGARLRFAIADTDADGLECTIWSWDANGGAFELWTVDVIAGSSVLTTCWDTGETLTSFFIADTLTTIRDHCFVEITGAVAEGLNEARLDLVGAGWMFASWSASGYSGTSGTDGRAYVKWY